MFKTKRHAKLQKANAALSKRSWAELHGNTRSSRHQAHMAGYIVAHSMVTRALSRNFLG
jgi:hypothetical protein